MKFYMAMVLFLGIQFSLYAQSHNLKFITNLGEFKVKLYDSTPNHREMMLEAVRNGTYQDALFNRIVRNFVVQGGERDEDIAIRESKLPKEQHVRLSPEFSQQAFHKIGALGAGRDDNSNKASFINQIYFVVGQPVSRKELSEIREKKGIQFTLEQEQEYLNRGGLPKLDGDYTVFGEIYEGLDVILEINRIATDSKDYPHQLIRFHIEEI